jgi:hypothetical protein
VCGVSASAFMGSIGVSDVLRRVSYDAAGHDVTATPTQNRAGGGYKSTSASPS